MSLCVPKATIAAQPEQLLRSCAPSGDIELFCIACIDFPIKYTKFSFS